MKKLINCISFPINPTDFSKYSDPEEAELAKRKFYDFISDDYILGPILKKHTITYETFKKILDKYLALGYNYWDGPNHIPVSLFSFSNSLNYIMSNKAIFERESTYNEIIEFCYNSIKTLR
jgi:hypothetical protein